MPDWFLLLLAILTCYRFSMLVTQDEIAKPIRSYFGLHPLAWVRTYPGFLVHCPYCFGVWVALALALILWPISWLTLLYWGAIAGGQAALQRLEDIEGQLRDLVKALEEE